MNPYNLVPGKEYFYFTKSSNGELRVYSANFVKQDGRDKRVYIFLLNNNTYDSLNDLSVSHRVFQLKSEAVVAACNFEIDNLDDAIKTSEEQIEKLQKEIAVNKLKKLCVSVSIHENGNVIDNKIEFKNGKDFILHLISIYGKKPDVIHSKAHYDIWKYTFGRGGIKGTFNSYVNKIIKECRKKK